MLIHRRVRVSLAPESTVIEARGDVDGDDAKCRHPRAIFCLATMMTPVVLATLLGGDRCGKRVQGPAGRALRRRRAWSPSGASLRRQGRQGVNASIFGRCLKKSSQTRVHCTWELAKLLSL